MGTNAPKTAPNKGAPAWLIQAAMDGGWIGKDGKATPNGHKKPAAKPASTDNGTQYKAAQGLKSVTRGSVEGPYGLRLHDAPPLGTKGEGIKMDHGIRTIGYDRSTQLFAARAPKFHGHRSTAPVLHYTNAEPRAGSQTSRAAGPKPKATPKVHQPDVKLAPSGASGVYPYGSTRNYKLVPNS